MVRLNPKPLHAAQQWLAFYEQFWSSDLDHLQDLFEGCMEPGNPATGKADIAAPTVLTIRRSRCQLEGTEITIRHDRFTTEACREGHTKGRAGCLDKLTQMLER